jgi:hypothetical protein
MSHCKVKYCVEIGGRFYHTPTTAAKAWSQEARRAVVWLYAKVDKARYQKRFHIVNGCYANATGAKIQNAWFKMLEKKAYRRSYKIFKRVFEGNE